MNTENSRLWKAVENNDLALAKSLFRPNKTRKDINSQNKFGQTPLMYLLNSPLNKNVELIKLLLENGADVNITDNKGDTALFYLFRHRRFTCLDILLDTQIDVNIQNKEKETALFTAVLVGNYSAVEKLLKKGAKTNIHNILDQTVLSVAIRQSHYGYVYDIHYNRVHDKIMKLLLAYGESPHTRYVDYPNNPIIFDAISGDNTNIATQLLDAGVDVNSSDSEGNTILMKAVEIGSVKIVSLLLSRGADVNCENRKGQTVWDLVKTCKHSSIANLMKTHAKKLEEQYSYGFDLNV